jgi:hypothetical protein
MVKSSLGFSPKTLTNKFAGLKPVVIFITHSALKGGVIKATARSCSLIKVPSGRPYFYKPRRGDILVEKKYSRDSQRPGGVAFSENRNYQFVKLVELRTLTIHDSPFTIHHSPFPSRIHLLPHLLHSLIIKIFIERHQSIDRSFRC